MENKDFSPVPFWQVKVQTEKGNIAFSVVSRENYDNREAANQINNLLQEQKTLYVQSVEKKDVNQEPPLLYDLTTLQKEANTKHGFSADKTLSLAQKLYETHKLITYPRTGSRYISEDVFDEIPQLIESLQNHSRFGKYAKTMVENVPKVLNNRSVNDKKVTDHHALLITGNQPKELTDDEQTIYEMVAGRMLESFSQKCVKEATSITFTCGDTVFEAKGSVIRQAGWRAVFDERDEADEQETKYLPELTQGNTLPVIQSEILEKQTKPKPIHTEASLLSAMENAGKEVIDEVEREARKESGIGTPATRAAIIETLLSRDYICRDKKSLIPTDKGMAVFDVVKDKLIANVSMTGEWENSLLKIERGEMDANTFRQAAEAYTRQITTELLNTQISASSGGGQSDVVCPKCKNANICFFPKVVKCADTNCGLIIFRTISEKQLSDKQITDLLNNGKTSEIKGFKNRNGKPFNAPLKFDENFRVIFDFPERKEKK
jgi:DNA topoisomerase-3